MMTLPTKWLAEKSFIQKPFLDGSLSFAFKFSRLCLPLFPSGRETDIPLIYRYLWNETSFAILWNSLVSYRKFMDLSSWDNQFWQFVDAIARSWRTIFHQNSCVQYTFMNLHWSCFYRQRKIDISRISYTKISYLSLPFSNWKYPVGFELVRCVRFYSGITARLWHVLLNPRVWYRWVNVNSMKLNQCPNRSRNPHWL